MAYESCMAAIKLACSTTTAGWFLKDLVPVLSSLSSATAGVEAEHKPLEAQGSHSVAISQAHESGPRLPRSAVGPAKVSAILVCSSCHLLWSVLHVELCVAVLHLNLLLRVLRLMQRLFPVLSVYSMIISNSKHYIPLNSHVEVLGLSSGG